MLKRSIPALMMATMVVVLACDSPTPPGLDGGRRVVIIVPDTVGVRQSVMVNVTVTDRNGAAIPGAEVTLLSSAPSLASLDAQQRLTGHAEGSLQIIATSGAAADTADIVVALSLLFAKQEPETGYPELFTMTRHGTELRNLTQYQYTDVGGAWSPDRKRIAFWSSRTASGVILLMNDDGTNVQELATGLGSAYDMAWSPDGSKIAFAGGNGLNDDIWVIRVDGSGLINLTSNAAYERSPAWSPDGTRIAFQGVVSRSTDVHVMNADGSGVMRLTTSLTTEMAPVWSPDGQQIAFTGDITPGTTYGIHVMNADGTNLRRIGTDAALVMQFDWSPNGAWFAYAGRVNGQWDLYMLPATGGDPVRITNDAAVEQDVRWR